MPLHPEGPLAGAIALHRLDQSVVRRRDDCESLSHLTNALMVTGRHPEPGAARGSGQPRARSERDVVPHEAVADVVARGLRRKVRDLRGLEVDVQGSTAMDIEQLRTAADRQQRPVVGSRELEDLEVERVLCRVDVMHLAGLGGLAVERRVDIASPGHDESVEPVQVVGIADDRHVEPGLLRELHDELHELAGFQLVCTQARRHSDLETCVSHARTPA
ncbi:MAG TPA: hypothetical protein VFQ74_07100 [Pseudolysinimonas sp.]|nr:hypothetical protein [Pseudolysinimonas sp.]